MVEVPVLAKYKSVRRGNVRMYMIGGVTPAIEASGKKDLQSTSGALELERFHLSLEAGFGFDLYYPLFKVPPETRFSRGMLDMVGTRDNPFGAPLQRITVNTVTVYLLFQENMNKRTALITGATSGIGEATARVLATNNFNLILCGRRVERLEALQRELSPKTEIHTLSFDVRDRGAVEASLSSLEGKWKTIDVLINNAGNAHGMDPIQSGNVDDWDAMMDINVKGL